MITAKKHFGQNFLKDNAILNQIIQAIPKNATNIVEIGPGLGDLTKELLKLDISLVGYEIDRDLYEILSDKFADQIKSQRYKLIVQDALKTWETSSLDTQNYFLVANLPYYVATKMILRAIDDEFCDGFIVMIQKEVAQKFSAQSGDKEFSALSILANLQGECEILFDVMPSSFEPPPKVVSAVIRMIKTEKNFKSGAIFGSETNYESFKKFLKICFLAPRKTLLKNLSSNFEKDSLKEIFEKFDINPNARAHELNFALILKIFKTIKANNGEKH